MRCVCLKKTKNQRFLEFLQIWSGFEEACGVKKKNISKYVDFSHKFVYNSAPFPFLKHLWAIASCTLEMIVLFVILYLLKWMLFWIARQLNSSI